jgi:hypothetical protein
MNDRMAGGSAAAAAKPERQGEDFARVFAAAHGRPPNALHLGNVANNAYHNAKLMRSAGVECDVVAYDYYHVMACPEWEDADFASPPQDQFHPDWTSVPELATYERPSWFVQGPAGLCIRYLVARRDGDDRRAALYWRLMSLANRTRKPAGPPRCTGASSCSGTRGRCCGAGSLPSRRGAGASS